MQISHSKFRIFVNLAINTPFCGKGNLTVDIFGSRSKDLSVSHKTLLASVVEGASGQDEGIEHGPMAPTNDTNT